MHDWQPVQHADVARRARLVSQFRGCKCLLGRHRDKGVESLTVRVDTREQSLGQLDGREITAFETRDKLRQSLCVQIQTHCLLDDFWHQI